MIPKLLHQIWLGPRPAPLVWTETSVHVLHEGLAGEAVPGGTSYASHFWPTTAERWGRGSVTLYPTQG